jgi:hypothetical protein
VLFLLSTNDPKRTSGQFWPDALTCLPTRLAAKCLNHIRRLDKLSVSRWPASDQNKLGKRTESVNAKPKNLSEAVLRRLTNDALTTFLSEAARYEAKRKRSSQGLIETLVRDGQTWKFLSLTSFDIKSAD